MRDSDTIFALATPPGRSALAVVRVSGGRVADVIRALTGKSAPPARRASLRNIVDGFGVRIDQALVTYFPGPNSFTGEDLAEFSLHGSRSVIGSLNAALASVDDVRVAEPGEFTRRAFRNGRIDLTQAEAIADLIDSDTEFQRRQALRVLDGALGARLRGWKSELVDLSASFESYLDFSDERDVAELDFASAITRCSALAAEMRAEVESSRRTLALRDGFTIVIAGPPNAGKSSLFNLLAGDEAAIVTAIPGTTRDVISRVVDLDGVPVALLDTAGMREAEHEVEAIGVERALAAARSANLVLWLDPADSVSHSPAEFETPVVRVRSKVDLLGRVGDELSISIHDVESVEALRSRLRDMAIQCVGDGSEGGLIRERHKSALGSALSAVGSAVENLRSGHVELAAEDCRMVLKSLGGLIGETTAEEILGEIFSRFCI